MEIGTRLKRLERQLPGSHCVTREPSRRDSPGLDRLHVTGDRFADVRPAIVPGLLAAYLRVEFKREFTARFVAQASRKPTCPAAKMAATGMLEEIAQAPFDS